jgi:NADPH2:quinone reductase
MYDSWQTASTADLAKAHQGHETNFWGAWRLVQAAIPLLRKSGHGRIVNVSSQAIRLDMPAPELTDAFAREAGQSGFQVVLDYVWGPPAEAFLAAITRKEFASIKSETRFVQVGESAGPAISLPAAVLRSTALTILGTAGIPPFNVLTEAFEKVMSLASSGDLHVDTERIPLEDIESAWERQQEGSRLVIVP